MDKFYKLSRLHGRQVASIAVSGSDGLRLNLLIADYKHERYFLQLGLANLEAKFLVSEVMLNANTRFPKS